MPDEIIDNEVPSPANDVPAPDNGKNEVEDVRVTEEATKKALEFYDEETPADKETPDSDKETPEKETPTPEKETPTPEKKSDNKENSNVEYKFNGEGEIDQQFIDSLSPALNEAGVSNEHFNDLAKSMTKYAEINARSEEHTSTRSSRMPSSA